MGSANQPLGPNSEWKTGHRVPKNGDNVDQFGLVTYREQGRAFPPTLDRKGTCAYRLRAEPSQTAATA